MESLPIELRFKIVRYLDIEILLSLEYKDEIMWEILRNPTLEKTKTWLIEYVSKFGIIYIPNNKTDFGLYNSYKVDEEGYDYYNYCEVKDINLWDSRLPEGFYKLRFLYEGFDLVKIGNYFLSSQDGPIKSFNELEDNEWGTSYKSRGFELVTEVDERLSYGAYEISSGIRPISRKVTIDDTIPTFYIVYNHIGSLVSSDIESKVMKEYSSDSTYNNNNTKRPIRPYILKDIKSKEVFGYKLQTEVWSAYNVVEEAHSDEGCYEFSVSWYRYLNKEKCNCCGSIPINLLIGFIITGSQNNYSYPGTIADYMPNLKYPDKSDSEED